jgi:RNA polymerase sigma factor (sigma-70 family)
MHDIHDLVVATQSRLRSYIAALGVAPCDVDDIAQEVYVAYARGSTLPPVDVEDMRWLKGIARNHAMNHFRRRARQRRGLERLADILEAAPTWLPDHGIEEQAGALDRCLDQLTDEQRDLVRRYYGHDEEAGALAAAFSRSADGIRRLMMKLRRGLRDCAERGMGGPPISRSDAGLP